MGVFKKIGKFYGKYLPYVASVTLVGIILRCLYEHVLPNETDLLRYLFIVGGWPITIPCMSILMGCRYFFGIDTRIIMYMKM
jgi:hypothetical protein